MKFGVRNLHIHSIVVHFTSALYPAAVFFLALSYYYRPEYSLFAYFHLMVLATLSTPLSYLSGKREWQQKYRGYRTRLFLSKLRYGLLLSGLGLLCICWYGVFPGIVQTGGAARVLFLLCNFAILPVTFYLGHLGGRLVFGGAH